MSFLSDQLTWVSLTILSLILVMAKGRLHRVHSKKKKKKNEETLFPEGTSSPHFYACRSF